MTSTRDGGSAQGAGWSTATIEMAIYQVCFRYKGTVGTLYGTGVRIGVGIFGQPSVASYENNAKRNTGFGLVVVEN